MRLAFGIVCGALLLADGMLVACSSPKGQPGTDVRAPKTWGGDLTPVVSLKEVMRDLIDPLSDNIFDAAGIDVTASGIREWAPTSDEDWAKVRIGATAMAEGVYLLKIPREVEPAGGGSSGRVRSAAELAPEEIKAKIEKDPVLWQAKIEALRNVGRAVLELAATKDSKSLFAVGEDLDKACEGCHLEFWYPRQKEMYRHLRKPAEAKP